MLRHQQLTAYNVNKNPTRCNSMQTFIYCKISAYCRIWLDFY
jgi:hypothetical protein